MTNVQVRRADTRFRTRTDWLDSQHSFSFSSHYDPANTHFGLLVVNNDDAVAPGTGFDTHPHRDMEIITWVLSGSLVHQDSEGNSGLIHPGLAQRMSAGTGILHSEKNDAATEPVHFVQMWVVPDRPGLRPEYQQSDMRHLLERAGREGGALLPVASGRPGHDAAVTLHQRDAVLHVARLPAGGSVPLPDAPYLHVFNARGVAELEGAGMLAAGDAVRVTDSAGGRTLSALPDTDTEVLVWEMHSGLGAA